MVRQMVHVSSIPIGIPEKVKAKKNPDGPPDCREIQFPLSIYLSGGVSRDSGVGVVVGVEQGVVELTLGVYPYKIKQSIQTKYFQQESLKL